MIEKLKTFVRRETLSRYKFKVGETVTQNHLSQSDFDTNWSDTDHFRLLGKIIYRCRKKLYGLNNYNFYKARYDDDVILEFPEKNIVRAFIKPYKFRIGQEVRIRKEVHSQMNPVTSILEPHVLKESARITKRSRKSTRLGEKQKGAYGLRADNRYLLQWKKNDSSYTLHESDLEPA